ncbi:hypothetical protein BDZ45DRAFT_683606 [Acephala macrosclerotiorum]|nr:hypothetical protein BDZ45DRAFT_683606 [Acephala macrosclerotiorum]
MQSPFDQQSPLGAYGALESPSPIWDDRFSTRLESFDDNEFERELTNWFDENKTYDNTHHSSGEGNIDPSLRSLSGKRREIAGQQESSRTAPTFLTPQSQERRSNEPSSASAAKSPNSTPTSVSNKRAIDSDESQQDATEAKDRQYEKALVQRELDEYKSKFDSLNKRLKYSQVEVHFNIKKTDSTIPSQTDNAQSDNNRGDGSQSRDQAMQAHQEHQAPPRLSLSSSRSNEESQAPTIFSQNQQPEDGQSVISQTTYRSNGTIYAPGGKSCETCAKYLAGDYYFSTWRNHFWATHYPQEGWYCLFCKVIPVTDDGNLAWQCTKCSGAFMNLPSAVTHFTMECWERSGLFKKIKPFNDHLSKCHPTHPEAFVLPLVPGQSQCLLCEGTFQDGESSIHHCSKIPTWTYKLSTPFPPTCECHLGHIFDTYEKMNVHIEEEYFKKPKQSSGKNRLRNASDQDGSSQGGANSNFDTHSQRGRGSQNGRRGQRGSRRGRGGRSVPNIQAFDNQHMALGNTSGLAPFTTENGSAASGSVGNALLSPRHLSQRHHAHLGTLGDLTADLQGLAQEGQLPTSNPHVDTQNIRLQTGNEPPPHYDQPVVTDGHPSFIRRTVTPPQPEQNNG